MDTGDIQNVFPWNNNNLMVCQHSQSSRREGETIRESLVCLSSDINSPK